MNWTPILLTLAIALAGCSGGDDTKDDPTTTTSMTSTTTSGTSSISTTATTTTTTSPGSNQTQDNRAPTASLSADVLEGEAPLDVVFLINGTDADGDALSWTLSFDGAEEGQGNSVPSNYSKVFEAAGSYVVMAVVTDGVASANASVTITVLEPAAPPEEGPTQEFSGSFTTGTPVECQYGFLGDLDGVTYVGTAVEPASLGLAYSAKFTSLAPAAFYGVSWFDAGGSWLGDHLGDPGATSIADTVPGSAAQVYFWSCAGGLNVDVHYLVA